MEQLPGRDKRRESKSVSAGERKIRDRYIKDVLIKINSGVKEAEIRDGQTEGEERGYLWMTGSCWGEQSTKLTHPLISP